MTDDLTTRIAVAIHGATPPNPDAALALHRAQAERVLPVVEAEVARLRARIVVLEAAVNRVRKRHPRGDEESSICAPGLWCPGCGHERTQNGYGACPDRRALNTPDAALAAAEEPGA